MKILLESDSFNISDYFQFLNNVNSDIFIYVLVKSRNFKKFKSALISLSNVKCINYDFLFNYDSKLEVDNLDLSQFSVLYFNDPTTYHLTDRDGYLPKYGLGIQNAMSYYLHNSIGVISFLIENSIDFVYFRNTPHHSIEWLLAKSAEFLKIPVYVSERHVLPWQYSISKGFGYNRDQLSFDVSNSEKCQSQLSKHIDNFIVQNNSSYKKALPSYEKNRLGNGRFKYYNPFKQLLKQFKRPHKFFNQFYTYKSYIKHTKHNIDLNSNYAVFFLHYQPERTTLPEGYGFHDQLRAIHILRMALPSTTKLYVKEHPSIFTYQCEPKARNPNFYSWVASTQNTYIVPIDYDTFSLVDNAIVVATVTGTVGLQSYIRKKPVIYFGRTKLKGKGVHHFKDSIRLEDFINDIINKRQKIDDPHSNLLRICQNVSVSGIPENYKLEDIDYHSFLGFQQNAHFKLLKMLLNNELHHK